MSKKYLIGFVVLFIFISGFTFYRYSYRLGQIKKIDNPATELITTVVDNTVSSSSSIDFLEQFCINLPERIRDTWSCGNLDKYPGGVSSFKKRCESIGYEYQYNLKGYFADKSGSCVQPGIKKLCADESDCSPYHCVADSSTCISNCTGHCATFFAEQQCNERTYILKQGKVDLQPIEGIVCQY